MEFLFRSRGDVIKDVLIIIYTGMRDPNQVFTVQNLDYLFELESSILRAEEGIIFLVLTINSSLVLGHFHNERFFKNIKGIF